MNDFENFVPGEWRIDGVMIKTPPHQPKAYQQSARRSLSWKTVLTASVFSIGAVVLYFHVPAEALGVSSVIKTVSAGSHIHARSASYEVPVGYWPRLVALLRVAPVLPDDDSSNEPEPLV
jgi:hypothetical protein